MIYYYKIFNLTIASEFPFKSLPEIQAFEGNQHYKASKKLAKELILKGFWNIAIPK